MPRYSLATSGLGHNVPSYILAKGLIWSGILGAQKEKPLELLQQDFYRLE